MKLRNPGDGCEFAVELLSHENNSAKVRIDGREVNAGIDPLPDGGAMLRVGARRMRTYAMRRGDSILIAIGPYQFEPDCARRTLGCSRAPIRCARGRRADAGQSS